MYSFFQREDMKDVHVWTSARLVQMVFIFHFLKAVTLWAGFRLHVLLFYHVCESDEQLVWPTDHQCVCNLWHTDDRRLNPGVSEDYYWTYGSVLNHCTRPTAPPADHQHPLQQFQSLIKLILCFSGRHKVKSLWNVTHKAHKHEISGSF